MFVGQEVRPPGRIPFAASRPSRPGTAGSSTKSSFLKEYFRICREADDTQVINWLIDNAKRMREDMFLDPDTKWECLDYQLLMLRAYAPEDVFTEEA
jgi:hypothetical protein